MTNLSAIETLEAYQDGDVIIPGMGVALAAGQGLKQYFNPSTGKCTPDWTIAANQPTIYPQSYSSSLGAFVVPDTEGMQWYYNNPETDTAAILDGSGAVKASFADRFQKTTYTVNGKVFTALKIIGNLAASGSVNDKVLYFKSMFAGKLVTCKVVIPVEESVGSAFDVVVNVVNEAGVSDSVIDNDTEYLVLNSYLQDAGNPVEPTSYAYERLTAAGYVTVTHVPGVTELSNGGKTLKVFESAVDGIEEYAAVLGYGGKSYRRSVALADTHDPYYIVMGRNTDSPLIKSDQTVTYTPSVRRRSDQAVQTGWAFSYLTYKHDGTTVGNASGASFSIPGSTVEANKGINVKITANKS